jgi:hypothetical protein
MSEQKYDKENFWFGWNGGEFPVHPETEVEVILGSGTRHRRKAWLFPTWVHLHTDNDILAFQITKLYTEPRKPREWWCCEYPNGTFGTLYDAKDAVPLGKSAVGVVHVREVLPEGEG